MPVTFRPDLPKILNLLTLLAGEKPGTDKYQAVKFFYLADKAHLNEFGRPITYETYFALPYGPVASTVKDLMERNNYAMRKLGLEKLPFLTRSVEREEGQEPLVVLDSALEEVDFSVFSKSDLRVFRQVIAEYGKFTFDELFKLTHKHHAYIRAWGSRARNSQRAQMSYEDMVDDPAKRENLVADWELVEPNGQSEARGHSLF